MAVYACVESATMVMAVADGLLSRCHHQYRLYCGNMECVAVKRMVEGIQYHIASGEQWGMTSQNDSGVWGRYGCEYQTV